MTGDNIFKITADVQSLQALIAHVEESELGDEERQTRLAAFLVQKEKLLAEKVDGYVSVYRSIDARKKARREEAAHLSELARQDEARMGRLKDAVKFVSEQLGEAKLLGKTRSITVSTSKRPAVNITDKDAVPEEFRLIIPASWTVDKKGVTDYVVATGEIPPGVETRKIVSVRFK